MNTHASVRLAVTTVDLAMQADGRYRKVEMFKSKAYWAIGITTLVASHGIPATASEFSSYEECILEKMGGVTSNVAAQAIKQACYKLTNPNPPAPAKRECMTLTQSVWPTVETSATYIMDLFEVSIYNPSPVYEVEEVVLTIEFDIKGGGKIVRDFKDTVYAKPQSKGTFQVQTGINHDRITDRGLNWKLKSGTACK